MDVFHPRWINLPGGSPINAVLLAASILLLVVRLRRELPVDLIDAHFGYIDGIAAAIVSRILKKPFIVTLRGSEVLHASYRYRRLAMTWALRRASRVIVVSPNLQRLALELGVRSNLIAEIPNGVNTDLFKRRPAETPGTDSQPLNGARLVLSIGNIIPLKGHHRVIEAIAGLVGRGLDVQLVIAGAEASNGGEYSARLRELVEKNRLTNRVQFLGRLAPTGVSEIMSRADVLCLASEREGCPNVVREALACGTPVVATHVGAVAKMVPDERFGFVVPVQDDAALEQALASALSRHWDREAIALWGASRNWEQVAEDVLHQLDLVFHQDELCALCT